MSSIWLNTGKRLAWDITDGFEISSWFTPVNDISLDSLALLGGGFIKSMIN